MNKSSIFYSWFPEAKCIDTSLKDFYNFCIENYSKDGLILDVGADMCNGLTKNILADGSAKIVYCFDLWVRSKPDPIEGTKFIEGDALLQVQQFLEKQEKKISIVEVDIRGLEKTPFHPDDLNLDYENLKTEPILDICMKYVTDNSIIILPEFHYNENLNQEAFALAKSFAKYDVYYECLCYGKGFSKSAWIIRNKKTKFYKSDLINMMSLL